MPSRGPGGCGWPRRPGTGRSSAPPREFIEFFEDDSLLHFREEEEILFPLLVDRAGAPNELLSRLLLEHVRMHRLVRRLRAEIKEGAPAPETLDAIGELLGAHIRAEEAELFPLMERLVSEKDLRSIRLARRERTPPPR